MLLCTADLLVPMLLLLLLLQSRHVCGRTGGSAAGGWDG
jgi:hypothetical protein